MYSGQYYNPFYPNSYLDSRNDRQIVTDIQKAINGEYTAIACYEKLAQMAPSQAEKKQIREIQDDEKRHFDAFRTIYTRLTGRQPAYQLVEECPNKYQEGLEFAFRDEQKTVDFYLEIADSTQDFSIKETFRRAAADEQNHAVWFLFFFSKKHKVNRGNRQIENYGAKGALNASTLTLPQMLTYALQDEFLAQARYNNILSTFGNIRTFAQIKEAELRHIQALLPLFERYQVALPADVSQSFVSTPASIKAAFAKGVQGEIDNIAMYNKFLNYTLPADVQTVFTQLRNASLNHLAAFERGLARDY